MTKQPHDLSQRTSRKLAEAMSDFEGAMQEIERARRDRHDELWLDVFGLTEVPESLGHLTWLRVLSLSSNRLTEVPGFIGLLTELRELDLGDNDISRLPAFVGQLTQLRKLHLDRNE